MVSHAGSVTPRSDRPPDGHSLRSASIPSISKTNKKGARLCSSFLLVRETGIEPVRFSPHAPQTCASASSATPACRRDCDNVIHYTLFSQFVKPFFKFSCDFFDFYRISKKMYGKTKNSCSFPLAKAVKLCYNVVYDFLWRLLC